MPNYTLNENVNRHYFLPLIFALPIICVQFCYGSQWESGGNLVTGRGSHASVLLKSGKVLVMGGSSNGATNSCELYFPDTNSWVATGSMATARQNHNAISLGNGKVMVIGGTFEGGLSILGSCEIFDPDSGTWSATGSLASGRIHHSSLLLKNGKVLTTGGTGSASSCEIYDPNTGIWSSAASFNIPRNDHRCILLKNGKVLAVGGDNITSCEIYDPENNTWTTTSSFSIARERQNGLPTFRLLLLKTGKVLLAGGRGSSFDLTATCEIYDPENGSWSATGSLSIAREHPEIVLLKSGKALLMGGNSNLSYTASCELFDPETGKWSEAPSLSIPRKLFSAEILGNGNVLAIGGGGFAGFLSSVELLKPNSPPEITASGSPTKINADESVSFTSEATDPDGDALTYAWDFGDGTDSSEQNPTHIYSTAGTYTAKVTVTDTAGNTASATVTITVSEASDGGDGGGGDDGGGETPTGNPPTARFTTNTVVGFVNSLLTFDGTFSTDPENNIVSYSWGFGDESPAGTEKTISKIYSSIGTYTVKLTVTDGEGFTNTASRQIEVLSEEASGSFNAKVEFNVRLNFKKENKDSFKLIANVNVGTQEIASGTIVKVDFAGNTFTGELDTKLQDKSEKNEKWKVKANTNRQAAGEVKVQLKVKKANLAAGFQEAGVTAGDNPKEEFELDLPVKITIGDRTIETTLDSTFKFNKKATKAKGSGELE